MRIYRSHSAVGYTLAELIVVVAILGLAGALLVPRLIDADTFSVQAAARSMIADVTYAQNDAWSKQGIRRFQFLRKLTGEIYGYAILAPEPQETYDLAFNPDTAQYLDDPTSLGTGGSYIVDFEQDSRFSGVTIESVNFEGRDWIAFDTLGGPIGPSYQPSVSGGEIRLGGESGSYLIRISGFTGKIDLERIDE